MHTVSKDKDSPVDVSLKQHKNIQYILPDIIIRESWIKPITTETAHRTPQRNTGTNDIIKSCNQCPALTCNITNILCVYMYAVN